MITLRDYQQEGVNAIIAALGRSKRRSAVYELPTGGGKTVVFSYIEHRASVKNSKTLVITDRTELLDGTGKTLEAFGSKPEYIQAGRTYPPRTGNTFVAMAQTLKKRISRPDWKAWFDAIDLVIIDECHKQEFNDFFKAGVFASKTVIGFSATPKRGGKQRQLAEDYDEIVHTLTTAQLIEMGHLMPDMYYGFSDAPDMTGVKKNTKGDYSESDMFKRYDTPKLYGGVIDSWKEHTPDTVSLIFCTNIIHCVRTVKEFVAAGIPAKFVCSPMSKPKPPDSPEPEDKKEAPPEWVKYWEKFDYYNEYIQAMPIHSGERKDLINRWKSGQFKVMVNAGILTTGFDFPAIETIALFRATISEVLYLQMLGRGSRPSKPTGKTHFNILDFGANAARLGGYKMPRVWNLYHDSKAGSGVPPIKECGIIQDVPLVDKNNKNGCGDYVLASAKMCPSCGYLFPVKAEPKKVELELKLSDANGDLRSVKPISQMSFDELETFQKASSYKSGWLYRQICNNPVTLRISEVTRHEIDGALNSEDMKILRAYFMQKYGREALKTYAKHKGYSPGWVTITMSRMR